MTGRQLLRGYAIIRAMRIPISCLVALALASAASAQVPLPATPDAKQHPQLAAMKTWLEARSPEARQCALRGGLFLDADRYFRQTKSEEQTVEALVKPADRMSEAERQRLRAVASQLASMASALSMFDSDTAAIAFAQMCMSRAQRPGFEPPPQAIRAQLEGASHCQAQHAAQSLDRKECVANAFRLQ